MQSRCKFKFGSLKFAPCFLIYNLDIQDVLFFRIMSFTLFAGTNLDELLLDWLEVASQLPANFPGIYITRIIITRNSSGMKFVLHDE